MNVKHINMQGLTLVELMVALVLGLFLTGIIATMYVSSKAAFGTSAQLSRTQETTRFATSFLKRDIRMAGYTECSNQTTVVSLLKNAVLNENGIFGWEYTGTDVGNSAYTLNYQIIDPSDDVATARASNSNTAGNWTSNGSSSLPSVIHDLEPLNGSDIILVTQDEKLDLEIVTVTNINSRRIDTQTPIQGSTNRGHILKIGNCTLQNKFQNQVPANSTNTRLVALENLTGGTFTPGNIPNPFAWSTAWNESDSLFKEKTTIYYVGTGSGGIPALFRLESYCGLSPSCNGRGNTSEIVEGVESMQILYGEDTDADQVANIYRSATNVTDFSQVVAARIGLLIRSPESGRQDTDTANYVLADSININVPDQLFLRFVTNETIHLRNKANQFI